MFVEWVNEWLARTLKEGCKVHIEGSFQHFCLPRDCSYSWGSSVGEESVCNAGNPSLIPVRKIHWRRDRLPTPVFFGFPGGSAGKESACNVGDLGSMPGLGRSPREGYGYPLQYSGLKKSMNCIVHGVAKSWTWLSDFHFQAIYTILYILKIKKKFFWSCYVACGIYFPDQGLNLCPLHWEHEVLTTVLLEKCLVFFF